MVTVAAAVPAEAVPAAAAVPAEAVLVAAGVVVAVALEMWNRWHAASSSVVARGYRAAPASIRSGSSDT